ncbi:ABC transporter permease [Enterococcus timonensis]|uniref:ABC transporter permease n=1 Tax=Enterococcus timonensis TaxID=1852364 RepID=UPI0008D96FD9|nr:ABC transporter permease [Enterococcus timonensis]
MTAFFRTYGGELLVKFGQHFLISFTALALGIIIALPLGILIARTKTLAKIVMGITSALQTVPSLALLAIMIPIFGIGFTPAVLALFIYSLLPIMRNTFLAMKNLNPDVIDAGVGMGMTRQQLLFKVQLPLGIPTIMAGVRLASVYVIAWATLASYIGAGGLGDFIFQGLNLYRSDLIFAGTIPVTIMALLTDYLLSKLEHRLTPKPLLEVKQDV